MGGAGQRVSVAVLLASPKLDGEVEVGQGVQPASDHSLWFLHGLDPFQSLMIRPKQERAMTQIVPPVPQKEDDGQHFSFVG